MFLYMWLIATCCLFSSYSQQQRQRANFYFRVSLIVFGWGFKRNTGKFFLPSKEKEENENSSSRVPVESCLREKNVVFYRPCCYVVIILDTTRARRYNLAKGEIIWPIKGKMFRCLVADLYWKYEELINVACLSLKKNYDWQKNIPHMELIVNRIEPPRSVLFVFASSRMLINSQWLRSTSCACKR